LKFYIYENDQINIIIYSSEKEVPQILQFGSHTKAWGYDENIIFLCFFALSNKKRKKNKEEKMFEKIVNEMKVFDKVVRDAYEDYEKAKKELSQNYK